MVSWIRIHNKKYQINSLYHRKYGKCFVSMVLFYTPIEVKWLFHNNIILKPIIFRVKIPYNKLGCNKNDICGNIETDWECWQLYFVVTF